MSAFIAALFQCFVKITGCIPQALVFRLKVYYEDRSVQSNRIRGKAIVACNHNDVMDVGVLLFVFWRRTLRPVVAELMYEKNFFMTLFLRLFGSIKADRDAHDFSFLGKCERILSKGGVVEIYPEARLPKKGEETPLPFKPSAVYLALETDTPIIPVYSNGKLFSKEHTKVMIGKPIDVRALYDDTLSQKENIEQINTYLRGKIIELGNEIEKQEG